MVKMRREITNSGIVITEAIIDGMKARLLQQLAGLGEEYNDDDVLDSSFADSSFAGSFAGTSAASDSSLDDDANISLIINDDTGDDDSEGHFSVMSEISVGEQSSGSPTNDSDDSNELIENLRRVRFDETPSFRTISPRGSNYASTSEEEIDTATSRTNRRSNPSRLTQKTTLRSTRNTTSKHATARRQSARNQRPISSPSSSSLSSSSSTQPPSKPKRRGSTRNCRRQSK